MNLSSRRLMRSNGILPVFLLVFLNPVSGQVQHRGGQVQQRPNSGEQGTTVANPDGEIVTSAGSSTAVEDSPQPGAHDPRATMQQKIDASWAMLAAAARSSNADTRTQALGAFGTMGADARSCGLILKAMSDPDLDVRTAAILAAVQTGNRSLAMGIRSLLDDKEPQVAFAAATALWKMKDRSGEDILLAVVDGERTASPTLVNGTMHSVNKQLHHPGALAKMGVMQGASMVLGPFGFGLTAIQYMYKSGGDVARVVAVQQLAEERTGPVRKSLTAALADKDPAVRAAAAQGLGGEHDRSLAPALYALLDDPRQPVRLTAAAACLNALSAASPHRAHAPHV